MKANCKTDRYIIYKCIGCNKVSNGICEAYPNPSALWRNGKGCPLASHIGAAVDALKAKLVAKERVGQQKHKKTYKF